MARQRTPTNVLERAGAFRKDPKRGRARKDEPKDLKPFPKTPPKDLRRPHATAWRAVVTMVPDGVLKASDVAIVRAASLLYMELCKHPEIMETARIAELRRLLGALGCTPADRSKVTAPGSSGNPFDDL